MSLFRCRRCLYPNTKPDLHFNSDGVCSACQAYDRRQAIDWNTKRQEFLDIVYSHSGSSHDCIVACSGGKDSTAQIARCLKLGLRPLAVTATTDDLSWIGRKNLDNISNLCDHIEVTVHKPTRQKISAFALREIGDISWCEHHLIWSVPAREALNRHIPIVLYGECPQNEYGAGPDGSEKQTRLTQEWVHEFGGLLGLRLSDLSEILDIEPRRLEQYRYPLFDPGQIQALFMGAYFPWDGYENSQIAQQNGFHAFPMNVEGSICDYENIDNYQTGIHDYLRYLKFGYGRALDIASSHIRRGRMTRDESIRRIRGIDGIYHGTYLGVPFDQILMRIGITKDEFTTICDRFKNKEVLNWASQPESFQCYYSGSMEPSKASNSIPAAA